MLARRRLRDGRADRGLNIWMAVIIDLMWTKWNYTNGADGKWPQKSLSKTQPKQIKSEKSNGIHSINNNDSFNILLYQMIAISISFPFAAESNNNNSHNNNSAIIHSTAVQLVARAAAAATAAATL